MAKNILNKLAVATAGLALSLAAIEEAQFAFPAQAAILTYDFSATGVDDPTFNFSGFFSFDDSSGTKNGTTELFALSAYSDNLILNPFNQYYQSFQAKKDNGSFVGLVGQALPQLSGSVVLSYNMQKGFYFGRGAFPPPNPNVRNFNVTYSLRETPTSIPEPSPVAGMSILGLGWLLRKKIASSQST